MAAVGLFCGSTTGSTLKVAELIQQAFGAQRVRADADSWVRFQRCRGDCAVKMHVSLIALVGLICSVCGGEASRAAGDVREGLKPSRLTIAMWDFSWLYGHYPGGWAEDFEKVTDELLERKFNTVRIDAFPLVIHDLHVKGQTRYLVPADPLRNWGLSTIDWEHDVVGELKEFMGIAQRKGLHVILSSWGIGRSATHTQRETFWKAWERVLDILRKGRLLEHVLYVDFDQEFPYFSPFSQELNRLAKVDLPAAEDQADAMAQAGAAKGAWNRAQRAFVRDYFESTLAHFHEQYPGMRFTFSLTSFWDDVRAIEPAGLDVLELHIWIKGQLDEYTGFNELKKDRNPTHDYRAYMAGVREAMKHRDSLREHMKQQLDFAQSWARELHVPLTTTEAWGPWWHMDHSDLEWDWLYDWCESCMGLSRDYGFWGSTPWNYSHPYWDNWANIEWYRRVNLSFLSQ